MMCYRLQSRSDSNGSKYSDNTYDEDTIDTKEEGGDVDPSSRADAIMLQTYARKYFREIVALLGTVPSELLLLLKTNDCLSHLDRALGAPVNTAAGKKSVYIILSSCCFLYPTKYICIYHILILL